MSDRTEQLRRNLETALNELLRKTGATIKDVEIAFQEEIENIYTDTPWWKVTNYWDIFNALFFEGKTAEEVIDIIVSKAEEYERANSGKELEESKLEEDSRRYPTANGEKIQLDSGYSIFPINGGSEDRTKAVWDALVSRAKGIIERENIEYYTITRYIQPNYGILKLNLRIFPSQEAKEVWDRRKHGSEEIIMLEESKSLTEKIPSDLAKAYRQSAEYRRGEGALYIPDLGDREGDLDFENTDYIEITPEEAEDYRKKGEVDKLRVIYWGDAYTVDPRSFKLKPSAGIKPEDEYITRTGRHINNSNHVPFSHMMEIADKIYYTNEGDIKRTKRNSDEWDSGAHSFERFEKSTLKDWEEYLDEYEKRLQKLEDSWEEGDISRKEYEIKKEKLLDKVKYWRKKADNQRFYIRNQARKKQDEYITKLIRKAVDNFHYLKGRLKSLEREAQWRGQEVDDAKSGNSYYQRKVKELKARIQVLQNELANYERWAGGPEIEEAENKLSKTLKEIEETKKQVDDLLKRKPDVKEADELEEGKRLESKKPLKEGSIGNELAKYQKWVDYDMKRYGKISDKTKEELKDAGLELVKDQYGDYEVIAKDK